MSKKGKGKRIKHRYFTTTPTSYAFNTIITSTTTTTITGTQQKKDNWPFIFFLPVFFTFFTAFFLSSFSPSSPSSASFCFLRLFLLQVLVLVFVPGLFFFFRISTTTSSSSSSSSCSPCSSSGFC
eukprot:GHVT01081769.1.p2 GENE.GHVT01081769.1~~GHVT01081769.1.p2  ORF type:complete len:125 (+),score=32.02 GHVT01081769.1:962-1336(+)